MPVMTFKRLKGLLTLASDNTENNTDMITRNTSEEKSIIHHPQTVSLVSHKCTEEKVNAQNEDSESNCGQQILAASTQIFIWVPQQPLPAIQYVLPQMVNCKIEVILN